MKALNLLTVFVVNQRVEAGIIAEGVIDGIKA